MICFKNYVIPILNVTHFSFNCRILKIHCTQCLVYALWENVYQFSWPLTTHSKLGKKSLKDWKEGKLVDAGNQLPNNTIVIGKSTFMCLATLKDPHFKKLAVGVRSKNITIWECSKDGGNPHFKTMMIHKWCNEVKKYCVVHN